MPPTIAAAKIGDEDEVRALCLDGADVSVEDPLSKWTALMWASCNGNLDCVEVLLEFQASHTYLDPERIKLHKGSSGVGRFSLQTQQETKTIGARVALLLHSQLQHGAAAARNPHLSPSSQ